MIFKKIIFISTFGLLIPAICGASATQHKGIPPLQLPYEHATFLVVYDHVCAVHAKLCDSRLVASPSIARQMDIENKKIALAERFAGTGNLKNQTFIVYPNGTVENCSPKQKKLIRTDSNFTPRSQTKK